jgi:hypothetical protein
MPLSTVIDQDATAAGALALAQLQAAISSEVAGLRTRPRETLPLIQQLIRTAGAVGAFDPWTTAGPDAPPKSTMLRGGGRFRKWKLQLFRIADGSSHPPHCHENLASCLVVLQGRIHAREYDRDRATETRDSTVLIPAFEGELGPGEGLVTTEEYRNCHWFGAIGGPALAVNFKASGFVRFELLRRKNRHYADPLAGTGPDTRTPFITSQIAKARYSGSIR